MSVQEMPAQMASVRFGCRVFIVQGLRAFSFDSLPKVRSGGSVCGHAEFSRAAGLASLPMQYFSRPAWTNR